MIFNHQMQPCQKTCEDMANCTDTGPPIAGCQCRNPFFVLELGKCIHPDQCGCIYNGTYLSVCVFHICNIMSDLTSPTLRIFKVSKDTISSVNHSQLYLCPFG